MLPFHLQDVMADATHPAVRPAIEQRQISKQATSSHGAVQVKMVKQTEFGQYKPLPLS